MIYHTEKPEFARLDLPRVLEGVPPRLSHAIEVICISLMQGEKGFGLLGRIGVLGGFSFLFFKKKEKKKPLIWGDTWVNVLLALLILQVMPEAYIASILLNCNQY